MTGTIPRTHPWEDTGGNFWQDAAHAEVDLIPDDQSLFMDTPKGLVVVLGCAHSGVINTLNYISEITGEKVIGGMQLLNASRDRLQATAEVLQKYQVEIIGANHCTGMKAIAFFWHQLAGKCISCPVGTRLNFGS